MIKRSPSLPPLDQGSVFKGLLLGLIVGAFARLWTLKRSGTATIALMTDASHQIRTQLDASSAAQDSIAEGKALARRNYGADPDMQ